MQQLEYTVTDPVGFHARPAGLFVKEAAKYKSKITVSCGEKSAAASKLFALMALGVRCGAVIACQIEGEDEAEAAEGIRQFLEQNL